MILPYLANIASITLTCLIQEHSKKAVVFNLLTWTTVAKIMSGAKPMYRIKQNKEDKITISGALNYSWDL
jgi:hypothetical protein